MEPAGRERARFYFFVSTVRRGHDPNVCGMFWVGVAFVVLPIDRTRDHADIAFVLILCCGAPVRWSWRGLVRRSPASEARGGGGFLALFLFLLREILRIRFSREGDGLSVRRPDGISGAFWQISKNKRIAACHRQNGKLWRPRAPIPFQRAAEQHKILLRRPPPRGVGIPLCYLIGGP